MSIKIEDLYWKEHLEDKILRHGVTPEEVEEVIWDGNPEVRKCSDNRYLIWGQSEDGRYLFIVLDRENPGTYVPVSARDMTPKEKQSYKKRNAKKS